MPLRPGLWRTWNRTGFFPCSSFVSSSSTDRILFFSPLTVSPDVAQDVHIECNSNEIAVSIGGEVGLDADALFDGMVYPRGLSKNSTCLAEFRKHKGPLRYRLPLRSCNTMSTDLVRMHCLPRLASASLGPLR